MSTHLALILQTHWKVSPNNKKDFPFLSPLCYLYSLLPVPLSVIKGRKKKKMVFAKTHTRHQSEKISPDRSLIDPLLSWLLPLSTTAFMSILLHVVYIYIYRESSGLFPQIRRSVTSSGVWLVWVRKERKRMIKRKWDGIFSSLSIRLFIPLKRRKWTMGPSVTRASLITSRKLSSAAFLFF